MELFIIRGSKAVATQLCPSADPRLGCTWYNIDLAIFNKSQNIGIDLAYRFLNLAHRLPGIKFQIEIEA